MKLTCIVCGKQFQYVQTESMRRQGRVRQTCSESCRASLRRDELSITCACGTSFTPYPGQKHCSRKCAQKFSPARSKRNDSYQRTEKAHGMYPGEYQDRLDAQGGVCAICLHPEKIRRKGKLLPLCVDHDHETGEIRGLICNTCNTALGKFADNIILLRRAERYLRNHGVAVRNLVWNAPYNDLDPLT